MKKTKLILMSLLITGFVGCQTDKNLKGSVGKILKENPEILSDAIKANPAEFMMALQEAAGSAKKEMAQKREEEEREKFEKSFQSPLEPKIRDDESFRGSKDGVITLVEYSDFECPFCKRGYSTVQEMLEKYKGKVRFAYKHLPLSFHPQAMPASQYYEAIRLQNEDKAWLFHDKIYENQRELQKGEKFLKKLVKEIGGIDMKKLMKDKDSKAVIDRIKADEAEAKKFGIQGTPGFVINGVPVRGAYPVSHFDMIIDKLKEKGKLKL